MVLFLKSDSSSVLQTTGAEFTLLATQPYPETENTAGVQEITAQTTTTANFAVYYFISDHLSTAQLLVDESKEIVWQGNYSPFGSVDVVVNTLENNFRFPGQYYDSETGLHYNWSRYYDPATGRYITADPIGLAGGMNLYSYVANDPVNFVDLWGLEPNGCGSGALEPFIPDFFPEACNGHDNCYEGINTDCLRGKCDGYFWLDMFAESGPWPNVITPTIYWIGVRAGGRGAFERARAYPSSRWGSGASGGW